MLVYSAAAAGVRHLFDVGARDVLLDRHPQRAEHELGAQCD
jgi:hypothetical protein